MNKGCRVWVINAGLAGTTVTKGIVTSFMVLKLETAYRVRLEHGDRILTSDCNVFRDEKEACAEAYRRLLDDADRMRRRAGLPRPETVAAPPRPAAAPKPTPKTIRIPERFYVDHMERDLPTPEDIGESTRYAVVRADDPALPELLNDAEYYAHPFGPDAGPAGVTMSAKATVRAIRDVIGWDDAEPAIARLRKA